VPGSSARQWILGYNHHLSKRTKLYAAYTRIDNGSGVAYGYNFKGGVGHGQDASSLSIGLRHAFRPLPSMAGACRCCWWAWCAPCFLKKRATGAFCDGARG
jgi:hypothetical protein